MVYIKRDGAWDEAESVFQRSIGGWTATSRVYYKVADEWTEIYNAIPTPPVVTSVTARSNTSGRITVTVNIPDGYWDRLIFCCGNGNILYGTPPAGVKSGDTHGGNEWHVIVNPTNNTYSYTFEEVIAPWQTYNIRAWVVNYAGKTSPYKWCQIKTQASVREMVSGVLYKNYQPKSRMFYNATDNTWNVAQTTSTQTYPTGRGNALFYHYRDEFVTENTARFNDIVLIRVEMRRVQSSSNPTIVGRAFHNQTGPPVPTGGTYSSMTSQAGYFEVPFGKLVLQELLNGKLLGMYTSTMAPGVGPLISYYGLSGRMRIGWRAQVPGDYIVFNSTPA